MKFSRVGAKKLHEGHKPETLNPKLDVVFGSSYTRPPNPYTLHPKSGFRV